MSEGSVTPQRGKASATPRRPLSFGTYIYGVGIASVGIIVKWCLRTFLHLDIPIDDKVFGAGILTLYTLTSAVVTSGKGWFMCLARSKNLRLLLVALPDDAAATQLLSELDGRMVEWNSLLLSNSAFDAEIDQLYERYRALRD